MVIDEVEGPWYRCWFFSPRAIRSYWRFFVVVIIVVITMEWQFEKLILA